MEKLILFEQDIINAVCVYTSRKKNVMPEEVEVELMHDDDKGFTAEAFVHGYKQDLVTRDLIESIRIWIDEYLGKNRNAGIRLVLDDEEGIIAEIK